MLQFSFLRAHGVLAPDQPLKHPSPHHTRIRKHLRPPHKPQTFHLLTSGPTPILLIRYLYHQNPRSLYCSGPTCYPPHLVCHQLQEPFLHPSPRTSEALCGRLAVSQKSTCCRCPHPTRHSLHSSSKSAALVTVLLVPKGDLSGKS